ncbi:MAG: lipid II flippase MurJ [Acidimicrobiia bacterium]
MAAATALSRATGLARTVVLASALGVTALADAYNVANTVPTMVFTFVVGGIATSALVPLLVRSASSGGQAETAGRLLGASAAVGVLGSVLLLVAAPAVVHALTIGAGDGADTDAYRQLATTWLRWCAPQVAFYAVGVAATSVLNANRRLFLAAFAPVLTNVVTIASVVAFVALTSGEVDPASASPSAVATLGAGTTAAVGAATLVQLLGARRVHRSLRPALDLRHPEIRALIPRAGWMILYVAMNQVGLAVVVAIASSRSGALSAYQWAFAVMQLPYALIAVSVLTAAYPVLTTSIDERTRLRPVLRQTGRSMWTLLLPAAVGLWVLADPIATALVGNDGADLIANATRGFAVSLVPFAAFQLLTRLSYARDDTRTPALVNVAVNAANIAAALAAAVIAQSPQALLFGLAVAHAASYLVGCTAMLWRFRAAGVVRVGDLLHGTKLGAQAAAVGGVAALAVRAGLGGTPTRAMAVVTVLVAAGCGGLAAVAFLGAHGRWRTARPVDVLVQDGSEPIQ